MMIEVSFEQSRSQVYMHAECCCRRCCCSLCVVAATAVLLLPVVRNRVPDAQICCWFIESDPSVFFLFIQTRFILMYPLAVLLCRIYGLDLPTSSVILGMSRAKAGVSPPRRVLLLLVFVMLCCTAVL